ncbi:HD-GYP domain-containing protein [Solidesulfovibrio sp.]
MTLQLPEYAVSVDDLQQGVYIKLQEKWFQHPFLFQNFKIKNDVQIKALKELGIKEVLCVPCKSDHLPLAKIETSCPDQEVGSPSVVEDTSTLNGLWDVKNERILLLKNKKKRIAQTKALYRETLHRMPSVMKNIVAGSKSALDETVGMVSDIASGFLNDSDSIVHLMDNQSGEDGLVGHSLNVTVLALMTGKSAKLSPDEMNLLGLGAFLHDIGKSKIEKKVLKKLTPFTKAEQELLKLHPSYGLDIVGKLSNFPVQASKIIHQHHEHNNGAGYPLGLKGGAISKLSMITIIANIYDTLCNPIDPTKALLPYHALSLIFTKYKCFVDSQLFTYFVRSVGIYPPGSVVQLSNDAIGMVISVNSINPLKPSILLYDPLVPKDEALIFGLDEEPELTILQCISPKTLPKEIYSYLDPVLKTSYFPEQQE